VWACARVARHSPLTRAYNECRNRYCAITPDAFETTYNHYEHKHRTKQVEHKIVKRLWVHDLVYWKLTEPQIFEQSKVRGSLWSDSTCNRTCKHLLSRDLIASLKIRKYLKSFHNFSRLFVEQAFDKITEYSACAWCSSAARFR
jgi:hypothetical protein